MNDMLHNEIADRTDGPKEGRPERIVAPAAKDPVVRYFILAAMLLGFAGWLVYDGYIAKKYKYTSLSWDTVNDWFEWAMNCIGPFVLLPCGLLVLIRAVLFAKRKLVADAEGIGYEGKERILWSHINTVDATKLKSKGYLYLHYGDGKKLTLDEWKLQRFRDLAAFVESHLPPEKIRR